MDTNRLLIELQARHDFPAEEFPPFLALFTYFRELAEVINAGGLPDAGKQKAIMLSYGLVPVQD